MSFRIMLAGGGTGGHGYPIVAVADELKKQAAERGLELELAFIGDGGVLQETAAAFGVPFYKVFGPKWRSYSMLQNILDLFKLPLGLFQALYGVWKFMPDVMFVKGGYAALLPALFARIMFIPIVVHDSDAIPGRVNVFFGKRATHAFVSYEEAKKYFKRGNAELVGNPIRAQVLQVYDKQTALAAFGFDADKPVLFVTGASQGAKIINNMLMLSLVELVKQFHIIHQCGDTNFKTMQERLEQIEREEERTFGAEIKTSYRLYGSMSTEQIAKAYAAADVVISRAGSTLFEIAAAGKPAIIVPLKIAARHHQMANANAFAKCGAVVITEENLTPHILINEIHRVFDRRTELGEKIKQCAYMDSASIIAQALLQDAE